MVRLRGQSLQDLANEYLALKSKANVLREAYKTTPLIETQSRLRMAKDILHAIVRANEAMVKIIDRFSPIVAKELTIKLRNHMQITERQLSRDYANLPEFKNMSESAIGDIINSTIDISMTFTELLQQFTDIAFIIAVDTVKRTRGRPPAELSEHLKEHLQKLDAKYVGLYESAWQALESENPDGPGQCSESARKLIWMVLGETSSARKTKLKFILKSDTEVELLESLADSVEKIYQVLNKGVHTEVDFETALLSLNITEHLLHYILERKSSNH